MRMSCLLFIALFIADCRWLRWAADWMWSRGACRCCSPASSVWSQCWPRSSICRTCTPTPGQVEYLLSLNFNNIIDNFQSLIYLVFTARKTENLKPFVLYALYYRVLTLLCVRKFVKQCRKREWINSNGISKIVWIFSGSNK